MIMAKGVLVNMSRMRRRKIPTNHANRGLYLEEWIEQANRVYQKKNKAEVHKIPTPWRFERKSTVDFGGTAAGKSIWFDAKATKNKTSFPLGNIKEHQIEYLVRTERQGGLGFFLIHSTAERKTWVLWIQQLTAFMAGHERKSIPFEWLEANCDTVKGGKGIMLDYLPAVLGE